MQVDWRQSRRSLKTAGKDGIAIDCISARLFKAPISMKSNFMMFVVAYSQTEEAAEGQKAKYMAALNSTVASVPAREFVFVLTDANARTGRRSEGGGEADSKVPGAFGRDRRAQRKRQTTAGFRRRQQARSSKHFVLHPQKWQRQPQQGTSTFGLYPDKAGGPPTGPLRHCPPAPFGGTRIGSQSCVRVRIPHRSAPNRGKRDITKEIPGTANLRRLMTDPNLRCQVANAMIAYHQSPMAPAPVTSPPTWLTSCFPLQPNLHRALSTRVEHRVGVRVLVWRLR